jgi:nucleotide-binding universal stress UspA family protein
MVAGFVSDIGLRATNQGGGDERGKPRSAALEDFRAARRRAALHAVLSRLRGGSVELLSYEEVADRLHVVGQVDRGVQEIPLAKIVGSVGRYEDFDRDFLPLNAQDAQRWADVYLANQEGGGLPPIEVYEIENSYFVIDGNHRVSIAHETGAEFMEAHVIAIKTRVPLPPDMKHEDLIIASEQAAFLRHTRLDKLWPNAEVRVSLPGQYAKLENHIEVHRFFIEMGEDIVLSDEEAVRRWYGEAYLPVVEVIREHDLLRGHDGRTEADLYLWIAENQAALRNELGWGIDARTSAARFSAYLESSDRDPLHRLYRRVIDAVLPGRGRGLETWSQAKTLDRYSDRLFAVLLAASGSDLKGPALEQALTLAQHDGSHVLVMIAADAEQKMTAQETAQIRERFAALLGDADLTGDVSFTSSTPSEAMLAHEKFVDMLVFDRPALPEDAGALRTFIAGCRRPLLITKAAPTQTQRALLLCSRRDKTQEALFVAAYMGEAWGWELILYAGDGTRAEVIDHAVAYLTLHEIMPLEIVPGLPAADAIFAAATALHCNLLIVGSDDKRPLDKATLAVEYMASAGYPFSLLICP